MLNSLRRSAGTWVVKIFLGVLVLSFAVWGIGDIFRTKPDTAVASVGAVDISGQQLLDQFNLERRSVSAALGRNFAQEEALALGLANQALNKLTQRALYDQEATTLGLTLSNEAIAKQIRGNNAFKNDLGNFDHFVFAQALSNAGFSEASYVEAKRSDAARSQLLSVISNGPRSPRALTEAIYRYNNEKRVFNTLTILHENMTNFAEPTSDQLDKYRTEHAERFMAPEYRALSFITLQAQDLAAEILAPEDDLKELYSTRLEEFQTAETRLVEQIVLQDENLAREVMIKLRNGEDYYKTAKEIAKQDEESVKLGFISKADLPEELADHVFSSPMNLISEPIKSPLGTHIFRVLKKTTGYTKSFSEVKNQLKKEFTLDKAEDAIIEIANKIEDRLAGGSKLEEIAEDLNLTHGRIGAIDLSGRNQEEQKIPNVPLAKNFLQTAFDTDPTSELSVVEAEDGSYFVVRIDDVIKPELKAMPKIRAQVRSQIVAALKAEIALNFANKLGEKIRSGSSLSEIGKKEKLENKMFGPATRSETTNKTGLPPKLIEEMFQLEIGQIIVVRSQSGEAHVLLQMDRKMQAKPLTEPKVMMALQDVVSQSIASDLAEQYRSILTRRHKIEINEWAVKNLFNLNASIK